MKLVGDDFILDIKVVTTGGIGEVGFCGQAYGSANGYRRGS